MQITCLFRVTAAQTKLLIGPMTYECWNAMQVLTHTHACTQTCALKL
jgi:hypothetical protein